MDVSADCGEGRAGLVVDMSSVVAVREAAPSVTPESGAEAREMTAPRTSGAPERPWQWRSLEDDRDLPEKPRSRFQRAYDWLFEYNKY